jgi:hypothetical protein
VLMRLFSNDPGSTSRDEMQISYCERATDR